MFSVSINLFWSWHSCQGTFAGVDTFTQRFFTSFLTTYSILAFPLSFRKCCVSVLRLLVEQYECKLHIFLMIQKAVKKSVTNNRGSLLCADLHWYLFKISKWLQLPWFLIWVNHLFWLNVKRTVSLLLEDYISPRFVNLNEHLSFHPLKAVIFYIHFLNLEQKILLTPLIFLLAIPIRPSRISQQSNAVGTWKPTWNH